MSHVITLDEVCDKAKSIPCSPWMLPKLIEILKSENAEAKDVEQLIMKDQGLAAATLKSANSAYFGNSSKCQSLREAIVRLGFSELHRTAAACIATRWLSNHVEGGYGWEPGDLSKHSLCVAVSSEILARQMGNLNSDLAYSAGLLHDMGKLALAYACADQFEKIRKLQAEKGCSWREAENAILGYDHTEVGRQLLTNWGFPDMLVDVAHFYPRPSLANEEFSDLVVHVHASKHLAIQIGLGVGEDGYKTELDEDALTTKGYTSEGLEEKMHFVLIETERVIRSMLH